MGQCVDLGNDIGMNVRLRFLIQDRDRHGNLRHYVRKKGRQKIRLRAAVGTPEFLAEYKAAIAALEAPPVAVDRKGRAAPPPKAGTLRWLCARYMASPEFLQLAPTTKSTRRNILEAIYDEPTAPGAATTYADFPLNRLSAKAVRVLRDRKAAVPDGANGRLKALRSTFNWAMQPGIDLMKENFAKSIPNLKPRKVGGYHPWTVEEILQFRRHHKPGTKPRLALELLLLTTQRRSDTVRLGRQHIKAGAFHFTQVKGATKDPVKMVVPIHDELAAEIARLPKTGLALLVTKYGKPFSAAGFGNWFREQCDLAGLPHCSAHGLRKAGSQLLAEGGATDREIMAMTGQRTAKEVDRYTRAARQKQLARRAVGKLVVPSEEGNEN